MSLLLIVVASLILLVLVSFGVEALRRRSSTPKALYWAPNIPIKTTVIDGNMPTTQRACRDWSGLRSLGWRCGYGDNKRQINLIAVTRRRMPKRVCRKCLTRSVQREGAGQSAMTKRLATPSPARAALSGTKIIDEGRYYCGPHHHRRCHYANARADDGACPTGNESSSKLASNNADYGFRRNRATHERERQSYYRNNLH
jgi:hypothetical protein